MRLIFPEGTIFSTRIRNVAQDIKNKNIKNDLRIIEITHVIQILSLE